MVYYRAEIYKKLCLADLEYEVRLQLPNWGGNFWWMLFRQVKKKLRISSGLF